MRRTPAPRQMRLANRARSGEGYEDTTVSAYPGLKLDFENIPNIHVVRESYNQLQELCQPGVNENITSWYGTIEQSRWLEMCRTTLTSIGKAVWDTYTKRKSLFCFHCNYGWNRMPQCCLLTSLCLDSYYRTVVWGF